MNRRDFMIATATITLVAPLTASAASLDYTEGLEKTELAAGKTLFLDFSATWCSTCKAQERVINALRAENPAYDAAISFVRVDWDNFGDGTLSHALNIPRRSTLVVLKGDKELGRIVAGTARDAIKALMDVALAAASA